MGLRLFACWDCGFEFLRRYGCLSLECVMCCQVQASAPSRRIQLNVVYLSVIMKPRQLGGPGPLGAVAQWEGGGENSHIVLQKV
jgi:hypothetical protein